MQVHRLAIWLAMGLLTGCGSAKLSAVRYEDTSTVTSSLPTRIELRTGSVTGRPNSTTVYAGGIFIPLSVASTPEVQFGPEDQVTFVKSLAGELRRHRILLPIEEEFGESTLSLVVDFQRTEHFPAFQEYRVQAQLHMACGELKEVREYHVFSSEGDSTWTKMGTDAATGKAKAASKLLTAMIPDIEKFVSVLKSMTVSDFGLVSLGKRCGS